MAGTVTVALKLPHGLVLRLFDMVKKVEPAFGGGVREFEIAQAKPQRVTLNGYAAPWGMSPNCIVVGGYALTPNVDAEFFQTWMAQNKESNLVKNHLIFAYARDNDTSAKAREYEATRCGLEPIDPEKPPQQFRHASQRGQATGISGITKARTEP
jgi:hypothetical protein